ncbi:unnamed protein product, partial [Chrysoparadoxa australica]
AGELLGGVFDLGLEHQNVQHEQRKSMQAPELSFLVETFSSPQTTTEEEGEGSEEEPGASPPSGRDKSIQGYTDVVSASLHYGRAGDSWIEEMMGCSAANSWDHHVGLVPPAEGTSLAQASGVMKAMSGECEDIRHSMSLASVQSKPPSRDDNSHKEVKVGSASLPAIGRAGKCASLGAEDATWNEAHAKVSLPEVGSPRRLTDSECSAVRTIGGDAEASVGEDKAPGGDGGAAAGAVQQASDLLTKKSYVLVDVNYKVSKASRHSEVKQRERQMLRQKERRERRASEGSKLTTLESHDRGFKPHSECHSAANMSVRLEGQWASSNPFRRTVGLSSIPAYKTHDPGWKCQDSCLAVAPFDGDPSQGLFAVFDGHGPQGKRVSRRCMEQLPGLLAAAGYRESPAAAFKRVCTQLHREVMAGHVAGDCSHSGTTLCAVLVIGRSVVAANVGDSRCILLQRVLECNNIRGNAASAVSTVASSLTTDHKPDLEAELLRITDSGGKVFPFSSYDNEGSLSPKSLARDLNTEQPRVWQQNGDGPGLAMSRSIGDGVAHTCGVTHVPEVKTWGLNPATDEVLIIASDGCWDVLSCQDMARIATPFLKQGEIENGKGSEWNPSALSDEICRLSHTNWSIMTEGGSDDSTCVVVKLRDVLKSSTHGQESSGSK